MKNKPWDLNFRELSNNDRDCYEKSIRAASNFIALIPTCSIRQMLANFSGVEFDLKEYVKVQKEKKKVVAGLVFTSSTKREIRHFLLFSLPSSLHKLPIRAER